MEIDVYGVYSITITADGETAAYTVSAGTVIDAVKAAGLQIDDDDFTQPDGNSVPENGMAIQLFRVTTAERTEIEEIDYEVIETIDDELYSDERYVLKEGVKGTKSVIYRDSYVDGVYVGYEAVSEQVITEPSAEEVQVGAIERPVQKYPTKVPVGAPISELQVPSDVKIGTDGVLLNYKKVINAKATAYCLPGLTTSTGVPAQNGYIAVDPREIPYGTEMYIVSADGKYVYGYCIAADTGGFIYDVDWTVDLHMNTVEQCKDWGRRDIIIYYL
jgi:3D (Asp-Asp-Asp) domain-containing protein